MFMRPFVNPNPLDKLRQQQGQTLELDNYTGQPPVPEYESHPVNAPLQQQNLLARSQGPLNPAQNPMGPGGMLPRPTFDMNPQIQELPEAQVNQGLNPQVAQSKQTNVLDEYSKLIGNRPERDELKRLMGSAPTREQYKPNKMTRLGATLGGISAGFKDAGKGIELAQNTLDRPYNEAQAEYEKKLRNVSALAGMESEDVQQRLQGFNLQRAEERDTRDFGLRQREFDARMEEMRDKDWEKITDEVGGRAGWTNRKTGQTIYGPQVNETLAQTRAREDQVDKAKLEGQKAIARIGADSREEVARTNAEAKKAVEAQRLSAALTRIKYAPMSESQRQAGLTDKLQSLVKLGINPDDFLDYDETTHIYSLKPESWSFYPQSEAEKAEKDAKRGIVMSQLGRIVQQAPAQDTSGAGRSGGTGGARPDEVEIFDAKTGKSAGYVNKSELAAALADRGADGQPLYKQR